MIIHICINTCIFKIFIAGLHVYVILLYNSVFKIHSIFNIEEHVLQIAYRNVVNYIYFYCACMIMYKAVFTLTWLS